MLILVKLPTVPTVPLVRLSRRTKEGSVAPRNGDSAMFVEVLNPWRRDSVHSNYHPW